MSENKTPKIKKEKDPINFIYMIKKIYPIAYRAKPSYFMAAQLIGIFHGISYGAGVMINQIFFDAVYDVSLGQAGIEFVFIMLVLFAVMNVVQNILNAVHNFMHNVNWGRISGHMRLKITDKSRKINPIEYENPDKLDDINKAVNGISPAIHFMITSSTLFTFYLPYFIFMGIYLGNLHPLLVLSILITFIPTMISQLLKSTIFSKLEDKSAPLRREYEAYSNAISERNFLKETRILGAFYYFKKLFLEAINSLNTAVWKAQIRTSLIDSCLKILSFIGYSGVLLLLVFLMLQGQISVGAFAAVYGSIGTLMMVMEEIIQSHIGSISSEFGLIRNTLRFLDMHVDERKDIVINKKSDIILENVSFRYPKAEHDSLKTINLRIKNNETIAIVGENGSGKTTLVKLIVGLYKPTTGTVKIDDTDITEINYPLLFKNISGVYQKYQKYKLSLEENLRIADYENDDTVESLLDKNGINYRDEGTYPQGLDTTLSREFDGVDLSGGQWQRIAIARGFFRHGDIIVLDEPTAAIDPIEESNIYKKFIEVAEDKTTILVTHRMGSAKIAERIIVMDKGEIVEIGTHDELIENKGLYSEMYTAQSDWYN